MKHRHHQQQRFLGGDAEAVHGARGKGVQHRRAVRKEYAFGIAGGPGRVAKRGRRILVEHRPVVFVVLRTDQFLVANEIRDRQRGHVRPVRHRDEALDRRHRRSQLFDQRCECQVEKQVLVFGVIGNVGDLLGKETRIDRVQHGAHAGHAIVEFHVPIAVPGQRGDAVAPLYAQCRQRPGDALRAGVNIAVRAAVDRSLDRARNNFNAGMKRVGVLDQRRNEQRAVLH